MFSKQSQKTSSHISLIIFGYVGATKTKFKLEILFSRIKCIASWHQRECHTIFHPSLKSLE